MWPMDLSLNLFVIGYEKMGQTSRSGLLLYIGSNTVSSEREWEEFEYKCLHVLHNVTLPFILINISGDINTEELYIFVVAQFSWISRGLENTHEFTSSTTDEIWFIYYSWEWFFKIMSQRTWKKLEIPKNKPTNFNDSSVYQLWWTFLVPF